MEEEILFKMWRYTCLQKKEIANLSGIWIISYSKKNPKLKPETSDTI